MKKLLFISIVSILFLGCQGEEAMDAPTQAVDANFGTRGALTTLCHWDAVTQEFEVISVNEHAVQAHLNHGDQLVDADGDGYTAIGSCTGSMDDCDDLDPNVNPEQGCDETVFAIAYSNLNGEDGYQEGSADVLISKLVDFNNDGVISPGDKVITHQCPTNFVPDSFADYTVREHVIDVFFGFANNAVTVGSDGINRFSWNYLASNGEGYVEWIQGPNGYINYAHIFDSFSYNNNFNDAINNVSGSPSAPNQSVLTYQTANGDHTFIDVDKFISQ